MESATRLPPMPRGVLAVIVVYERDLARVLPWQAMCAAMRTSSAEGALSLRRVLIYDNSPSPNVSEDALPPWACYVHDARNGGTAAAYGAAVRMAESAGLGWLLLLDHDTRLPEDFLAKASQGLNRSELPAALLPRVSHEGKAISPARVTSTGSICPLPPSAPVKPGAALTGIASGAIVRVDALRSIGPPPRGLWLDYVDHWLFTQLRMRAHSILVIEVSIDHDLSIMRVHEVSRQRMKSILEGEAMFVRTLPLRARLCYPVRLFLRASRLAMTDPRQAVEVLSWLSKHLLSAQHDAK